VTSNAVGVLIAYTLDAPPNGLGLRRCQWQTNASNEASRRVGKRMGFTFEGVQRFQRVIPSHKKGNGADLSFLPETTGSRLGQARDTAVFAHYCDEWAEKRKDVMRMMEPR
jgi:RimJ/RimL family protein N-acetyltransferase